MAAPLCLRMAGCLCVYNLWHFRRPALDKQRPQCYNINNYHAPVLTAHEKNKIGGTP